MTVPDLTNLRTLNGTIVEQKTLGSGNASVKLWVPATLGLPAVSSEIDMSNFPKLPFGLVNAITRYYHLVYLYFKSESIVFFHYDEAENKYKLVVPPWYHGSASYLEYDPNFTGFCSECQIATIIETEDCPLCPGKIEKFNYYGRCHSHGSGKAFFSPTDNTHELPDTGIKLVFGSCEAMSMDIAASFVVADDSTRTATSPGKRFDFKSNMDELIDFTPEAPYDKLMDVWTANVLHSDWAKQLQRNTAYADHFCVTKTYNNTEQIVFISPDEGVCAAYSERLPNSKVEKLVDAKKVIAQTTFSGYGTKNTYYQGGYGYAKKDDDRLPIKSEPATKPTAVMSPDTVQNLGKFRNMCKHSASLFAQCFPTDAVTVAMDNLKVFAYGTSITAKHINRKALALSLAVAREQVAWLRSLEDTATDTPASFLYGSTAEVASSTSAGLDRIEKALTGMYKATLISLVEELPDADFKGRGKAKKREVRQVANDIEDELTELAAKSVDTDAELTPSALLRTLSRVHMILGSMIDEPRISNQDKKSFGVGMSNTERMAAFIAALKDDDYITVEDPEEGAQSEKPRQLIMPDAAETSDLVWDGGGI